MVNRRISPDLKECALNLWDKGWEILDICDTLCVSRSSLYRWQHIFEEHGSVNRPPSPLRSRAHILTRAVLTAVHTLYEAEADLYLDELVLWLAVNHDIAISSSALQHNLQEAGLTRKLLRKIATECDEELRNQWIDSLQNDFRGDGSEFVCLNKTSKNEHSLARHYGRALAGKRAELSDVFV
jgi:transposase